MKSSDQSASRDTSLGDFEGQGWTPRAAGLWLGPHPIFSCDPCLPPWAFRK